MKDIPIVCINLKRAKERRRQTEEDWINKRNCPVEFIDAYDRRLIAEGYEIFPYDESKAIASIGRELLDGERACLTSHILAMRYIMDAGFEDCILIEDDVEPLFESYDELKEYISHLKKEFPSIPASVLYKLTIHGSEQVAETKEYFSILSFATWGTQATYMTKDFYKLYYDELMTMSAAADHFWKKVFIPQRLLAASNQNLVRHRSESTYIGNNFRVRRKFIP